MQMQQMSQMQQMLVSGILCCIESIQCLMQSSNKNFNKKNNVYFPNQTEIVKEL